MIYSFLFQLLLKPQVWHKSYDDKFRAPKKVCVVAAGDTATQWQHITERLPSLPLFTVDDNDEAVQKICTEALMHDAVFLHLQVSFKVSLQRGCSVNAAPWRKRLIHEYILEYGCTRTLLFHSVSDIINLRILNLHENNLNFQKRCVFGVQLLLEL